MCQYQALLEEFLVRIRRCSAPPDTGLDSPKFGYTRHNPNKSVLCPRLHENWILPNSATLGIVQSSLSSALVCTDFQVTVISG